MELALVLVATAIGAYILLRFWPQMPLERCSNCAHRRGSHWDDAACLRYACPCERYEP